MGEADDEEGLGKADAGADLTAEERDLIQQTRAAGLRPGEVVDRARKHAAAEQANAKPKPGADAATEPITPQMVARQADFAANMALAQRDLKSAVKGVVEGYDALKGDAVELQQVEAQAAAVVRQRADYATLNTPEKMTAALTEAAKAECDRRLGKKQTSSAADTRKKAEERLERQADAVESGSGGATHSAAPTLGAVGVDNIRESVFGTSATWPADENKWVNDCKAKDLEFVEKRMGRRK